jgi:hypothetical protein
LRGEVAQWIAEWRKLKDLVDRMAVVQRQFLQTRKRNVGKPSGSS